MALKSAMDENRNPNSRDEVYRHIYKIRTARDEEREFAADNALKAFSRLRPILSEDGWDEMSTSVFKSTRQPVGNTLFVALVEGNIVGSVVYNGPGVGSQNIFPADWAFLRTLAVDSAHTGKGIGKALTLECIKRARGDSAASIGLYAADKISPPATSISIWISGNLAIR